MKGFRNRFQLPVFGGLSGVLLIFVFTGAQTLPEPDVPDVRCQTAKECFYRALDIAESHSQDIETRLSHLEEIQKHYPESEWGKRAGLQLGHILLETQPSQALPYLQDAEKNFPLLRDYIRVWIAQALRDTDLSHQAATIFESILEQEPQSILKKDIHFGGGFAWHEAGQCHHAIHHLQKALALDPDSDDAPGALQVIAGCARVLDQHQLAIDTLRKLWWRYPLSPEAKTVHEDVTKGHVIQGSWKPSLGDYFRRAKVYYDQAHFESAIADLKRFLKGRPTSPSLEKGQFKLAMAHVRLKQYPQAQQLFLRLSQGRSSYHGQATEWLARVYLRQGQGAQLIGLSQSRLSGVKSSERSQIQWMCGIWYEDQGEFPKAVKAYQRAADLAGSSRARFDAMWRQGWLYYQQEDFQKAHQVFARILKQAKGWRREAQAQYWAGRSLANLGIHEKAQEHYRRVFQEFPMTYYGQLAQTRLVSRPIDSQGTGQVFLQEPDMSSSTRTLLEQDRHYQKAQELAILGLMEEATGELLRVSKTFRSTQGVLFKIAVQLGEVKAYDQALLIAKRHFRDSVERQRVPRTSALWSMAYPNGYLPTIQHYADSQVDPYLIAGIIREESLYNPQALSPVGAIGLMQLMPATAQRVANRIGLSSIEREDLFSGEINIQLGVQYVRQLLGENDGKVIRVIAAYNAGSNAVKRWVNKNGHREADEFVELISYKETRRYVKRVLTSYHVYRDLYSTRCSGSSLDKGC